MNVMDFYNEALRKNEGNLRPVDVKVSADANGTITQITVTYKPLDVPVNVPEFLIRK